MSAPFWPLLGTAILVHFLAVASPGPNFLMITRNSMLHSRQAGLYTALGIFCASLIQMSLGFLGVAALIEGSAPLYYGLRIAGATYLLYLGGKALWGLRLNATKQSPATELSGQTSLIRQASMTSNHAFRTGMITMITNPRAAIFFLAFFTTVLGPDTPRMVKMAMLVIMPAVTLGWHSTVALAFSQDRLRAVYVRFDRGLQAAFGLMLVALGAGMLATLS